MLYRIDLAYMLKQLWLPIVNRYRYMDYKSEVVYKRKVFRLGNFFSEMELFQHQQKIIVGTNFISQQTILKFVIPFMTHFLKIIKATFENTWLTLVPSLAAYIYLYKTLLKRAPHQHFSGKKAKILRKVVFTVTVYK